MEVIYYVINTETLYNFLLGHPWILHSGIVPSTLYQVTKYADDWGEVQMLIANNSCLKMSITISLTFYYIRIKYSLA